MSSQLLLPEFQACPVTGSLFAQLSLELPSPSVAGGLFAAFSSALSKSIPALPGNPFVEMDEGAAQSGQSPFALKGQSNQKGENSKFDLNQVFEYGFYVIPVQSLLE